jgi:hypothetical protein
MDVPWAVRAVLVGVFALTGLYCLARCVAGPGGGCGHAEHGRGADLAHAASSAAMIAMLTAGFAGDRWGVQVTVFGVGAGWFLIRALAARRVQRVGLLTHASMMGAMFWMSYGMLLPGHHQPVGVGAVPGAVTTVVLAGLLAGGALWWSGRARALAGGGPGPARGPFGAAGVAACHAIAGVGMSVALLVGV